jgi:hypothetical protein
MRYKPYNYNNDERLREHIEWCQKNLELSGNMANVLYVNEVHIWRIDSKGLVKDKDAHEFVQLKGVKIYLWWLQSVVE